MTGPPHNLIPPGLRPSLLRPPPAPGTGRGRAAWRRMAPESSGGRVEYIELLGNQMACY